MVSLRLANSLLLLTKLASTLKEDLINLVAVRLAALPRKTASTAVDMAVANAKCMTLYAPAAVATPKYRLNLVVTNQCTATIAIVK
jgi:hypothetical protein